MKTDETITKSGVIQGLLESHNHLRASRSRSSSPSCIVALGSPLRLIAGSQLQFAYRFQTSIDSAPAPASSMARVRSSRRMVKEALGPNGGEVMGYVGNYPLTHLDEIYGGSLGA